MIVSWLDSFNIRPSGRPLPGIQHRLQRGMWLTVTEKTSLGDFSLTGHKGDSVWSHYKWPQIFSTEHSEDYPDQKKSEREKNMGVRLCVLSTVKYACFYVCFWVCFWFVFPYFLPVWKVWNLAQCSPSHCWPHCVPKEGCRQACATSATCSATSRFFSPRPRQLPTCKQGPIMFVGTHSQARGTASGNRTKLKPLLNI